MALAFSRSRLALFLFLFALAQVSPLASLAQTAASDIACRPGGNSTDVVSVEWIDTNDGSAAYDLERQDVSGGGWSVVGTLAAGGVQRRRCLQRQ